jgi:hypothetical protein
MKFKIQVVAVSDDGREQTREIASLERTDGKHAWGGAGLLYRELSA